jgi:hypothetical protein
MYYTPELSEDIKVFAICEENEDESALEMPKLYALGTSPRLEESQDYSRNIKSDAKRAPHHAVNNAIFSHVFIA